MPMPAGAKLIVPPEKSSAPLKSSVPVVAVMVSLIVDTPLTCKVLSATAKVSAPALEALNAFATVMLPAAAAVPVPLNVRLL